MSIEIVVKLPDDVAEKLQTNGGDISRQVLESIALEGYRSDRLTGAQVMRILGFESRMELDAFLKAYQVYLDYTLEDIERDAEASRLASSQHRGDS
jgi:uncharacterized protein YgbK (DUF1537 family)